MLNGTLEDQIRSTEELNLMVRSILQAVMDHGGNTGHINELLIDTKGRRFKLNMFAREVVGGLWGCYGETVELYLSPNFYKLPQNEFIARYQLISVLPDMIDEPATGRPNWVTSSRLGPCRYTHLHFETKLTLGHVLSIHGNGSGLEYGGWLELIAYAALRVGYIRFDEHKIVAPGSVRTLKDGRKLVPVAFCARSERVTIGWQELKRLDEEKFGTDCFFLARVYEPKR